MIYKILHRKLKTAKQTLLITGGEVVCSGRVGCFCSTTGTRRINVYRHEHRIWKSCRTLAYLENTNHTRSNFKLFLHVVMLNILIAWLELCVHRRRV